MTRQTAKKLRNLQVITRSRNHETHETHEREYKNGHDLLVDQVHPQFSPFVYFVCFVVNWVASGEPMLVLSRLSGH